MFTENSNIWFASIWTRIVRRSEPLKLNSHFLSFIVFAFLIFAKLFFFQFTVEKPTFPQSISLFFLPKIAISLFIASFLFLTKKSWWTIPASFIIDIWIIGNIIYYRASGFFINSAALQMIDNLHGFGDSILIYFSLSEFIPFITTLLYAFYIIKINKKESKRQVCLFILFLILTFSMRLFVNYFHHSIIIKDRWVRKEKISIESIWNIIRPIIDSQFDAYYTARLYFYHGVFVDWEKQYVIQNTIIDFFFSDIFYYISQKYYANKTTSLKHRVQIAQSDKEIIGKLISPPLIPNLFLKQI